MKINWKDEVKKIYESMGEKKPSKMPTQALFSTDQVIAILGTAERRGRTEEKREILLACQTFLNGEGKKLAKDGLMKIDDLLDILEK